jgi:hypothetical protein
MADWGEVKSVRERMKLQEEGQLKTMYLVSAVTVKGISFTFYISEEDLGTDKVAELAQAKAAKLDAILEL